MLKILEQSWNAFFQNILIGFSFAEFAIPLALLLWSGLLLLSLKSIDCSDVITALMYVAFCCIAGIILVIIVPATFVKLESMKSYAMWISVFAVLSTIRWIKALDVQRKIIVRKKVNEQATPID